MLTEARTRLGDALLQRKLARRRASRQADAGGVAPDAEQAVQRASGSPGMPLPQGLQRKFEASLGADLGGVRVHTGESSMAAAESEGEHLLAHEVAHTRQQSEGGTGRPQCKLEVSGPADAAEVEADRAADRMVAGQQAAVGNPISAGTLHRSMPLDPRDLCKDEVLVEQSRPSKAVGPVDQDTANCTLGVKLTLLKLRGVLAPCADMQTLLGELYKEEVQHPDGHQFVRGTLSYRKETSATSRQLPPLSAPREDRWALGDPVLAPIETGNYVRDVLRLDEKNNPVLDGRMVFSRTYGGERSYTFTPALKDPQIGAAITNIGDNQLLKIFLRRLAAIDYVPKGSSARWVVASKQNLQAGAHYAVRRSQGPYSAHWVAVTSVGPGRDREHHRVNLYDPLRPSPDNDLEVNTQAWTAVIALTG